jgi:hypothetical protein
MPVLRRFLRYLGGSLAVVFVFGGVVGLPGLLGPEIASKWGDPAAYVATAFYALVIFCAAIAYADEKGW